MYDFASGEFDALAGEYCAGGWVGIGVRLKIIFRCQVYLLAILEYSTMLLIRA